MNLRKGDNLFDIDFRLTYRRPEMASPNDPNLSQDDMRQRYFQVDIKDMYQLEFNYR